MRDIEKRLGRLEHETRASPEIVECWMIEGGTATNMTTGETTTWAELNNRPVAAHAFRIGVLIVDPLNECPS